MTIRLSNQQLREKIGLPNYPYKWSDLQDYEDKKLLINENLKFLITKFLL